MEAVKNLTTPGSCSCGMLLVQVQIVFMLGYRSSHERAELLRPAGVGQHDGPTENEAEE